MTIVAISGHRPNKLSGGYFIPNPTYNRIIKQLRSHFLELKPEKIISGMALGVDTWSAEIAIELNIPFVAAVPFFGQEQRWPQADQDHYKDLLTKAEKVVEVCNPPYQAFKMQIRNEWIVDSCDILLAVFNGSSGGTKNCIDYAHKKSKRVIVISP